MMGRAPTWAVDLGDGELGRWLGLGQNSTKSRIVGALFMGENDLRHRR
jgi:hypothetical protein